MLMNGAGAGSNSSGGGQKFMEDCKREGKEVCVWTVNTAEEMRWCARWGVKAIITDRVAYCVSVREQVSATTAVPFCSARYTYCFDWIVVGEGSIGA